MSDQLEKMEEMIVEIRDLVHLTRRADDRMWSIKDIAAHCGYSETVTRRNIVNHDRFPRPRIIPGAGKRWVAEEVRQYFKSQRRG